MLSPSTPPISVLKALDKLIFLVTLEGGKTGAREYSRSYEVVSSEGSIYLRNEVVVRHKLYPSCVDRCLVASIKGARDGSRVRSLTAYLVELQ